MLWLSVLSALLSALTLTSAQFTYIFEVQDENRGPNSELFGDLSQYKFIPPSQLPRSSRPARPAPVEPQPSQPAIARREDPPEEQPVRRIRPLSSAAQSPRQFVVRAPQQDSRQALLRHELNQLQPAPQALPINYQAQPQTSAPVAQPAPQSFQQLQPHQTAHLNPVLRTIVPRAQQPVPSLESTPQDQSFELLQNFVRAQSQPDSSRSTPARQTLAQNPRYNPQHQPQPQPQPRPQQQVNSSPSVLLGSAPSGLPTLQISNKDSLTEDDLRLIEEHNRRVQAYLHQRQQEANAAARAPQAGPAARARQAQAPPAPAPAPVRAPAVSQEELNQRLAIQRAQLEAHNAAQERSLREREYRERIEREKLMQMQISQMLRPETRAQVAPQLQSLPYLRPQSEANIQAGVEYAPQPNELRQPEERQPEVRPVPVSYNNVRVPDNARRRAPPTTPAPRNYAAAVPRTTPAPQQSNNNHKPANLGLAALPADTDADGIPGEAGRDYPTLDTIPQTSFSCARQPLSGYYADTEAACQVVHLCQFGGVQDSFLCPNGTIWNQEKFSCQWWYEVSCANAPRFYALNQDLYKLPEKDDKLDNNNTNNKK